MEQSTMRNQVYMFPLTKTQMNSEKRSRVSGGALRWEHRVRQQLSDGTSKLEKEGKLAIVDASPIRLIPGEIRIGDVSVGKRDFSLVSLMEIIKRRAKKIKAKRIVIDPITALSLQYNDISERRTAILDLFRALKKLKTTNLITTELKKVHMDRELHTEEYLSHGVIVLYTFMNSGEITRSMRIEKMRGIAHDNQVRPYDITSKGIQVYPQEQLIGASTAVSTQQLQI